MSDELLNQDLDVEGHGFTSAPDQGFTSGNTSAQEEPGDEVEGHGVTSAPDQGYTSGNTSAQEEPDDEVEGHAYSS